MGICESRNNNITEITNKNSAIQIYKDIKINEIKCKINRVKECLIQTSPPFEKIGPDLSNVTKSICKIKIETILETIRGTGFLLKFYIDQEMFYCLISNEHVIKNDILFLSELSVNQKSRKWRWI